MNDSKNRLEEVLLGIQKRLDVLIALMLQQELREDKSLTTRDLISSLASLGLKYTEIASILGRSPSYISSELTKVKKKGGSKVGAKTDNSAT